MQQFPQVMEIAGRPVGRDYPVYVIAEAGVAHFGSLEKAFRLVDMAKEAGADAVKFQIFRTDSLISAESEEWRERLRPKELDFDAFARISQYCREQGVVFFATAHDEESLDFLDELQVPAYKIGSGEVDNWAFFRRVLARKKPVIFSTGMYTLKQVEQALEVAGKTGNLQVAVLHCVTSYPTAPADVNLRAMQTIQKEFGVIAGYSDHTEGIHFPLAAVALGARIIEKHISLDFNVPNAQDWKVSCDHQSLKEMISQIREIEKGLGTGVKSPAASEADSLLWARKSLVAGRDILPGEVLGPEMLLCKRPGTGISPADLGKVTGKTAVRRIEKDTVLQWEHLQ